MMVICLLISLVALMVIIAPFFVCRNSPLQAAASVNSTEKLEAVRQALLERYLEDEKAFEAKSISRSVWEKRKAFLANRFIDVTRRQDFLKNVADPRHPSNPTLG